MLIKKGIAYEWFYVCKRGIMVDVVGICLYDEGGLKETRLGAYIWLELWRDWDKWCCDNYAIKKWCIGKKS